MAQKKSYRIYCQTCDAQVEGITILDDPPTECPNNPTHTVIADSKCITQFYAFDNLESATDPTTGDDVADGYVVDSKWINTVTRNGFICINNAEGAAVWKCITNLYIAAFRADGYYRIAEAIDIIEVAKTFIISNVTVLREIAGTSGTTEIDILKNGTTIFTTAANRPKITSAMGDHARVTAVPDVIFISSGDRLEMTIVSAENGGPQDLVALLIPT